VLVVATIAQAAASFVTQGLGILAGFLQEDFRLSSLEVGLLMAAATAAPILALPIVGDVAKKMARQFAKQHDMNALMLGLLRAFLAGGKLFAYHSGVLVLGYSYRYFEARDLVRIGALLTLAEFFILLLLVPFYWPLIGIY
jgi:di/tricarboxylate transporter